MGFPGVWMTNSGSVAYRVVPKCACSTIGQILYYADQGQFYDGDIHDAQTGLLKWSMTDRRDTIEAAVFAPEIAVFTCVRNPFSRILSAFFDKICGVQRNGKRYRNNLVPQIMQGYGVETEENFDQIASFRRFLLFARDTIRFRKPMDPDIHWSPQSDHLATLVANGGTYDQIIHTEDFTPGMTQVLERFSQPYPVDLTTLPRFNESAAHGPKQAHPIADYFDDLSLHLMWETYRRDFELLRYDPMDPTRAGPIGGIDLGRLHDVMAN